MRTWQISFSLRSLLYFPGILGLGSLVGAYFVAPPDVSAKYSLWFLLSALSFFVGGLGSAVFGIWAARRIGKDPKYRNPEFHYRVATMIVVSLTFIYALCFPLVVSPDGMEYTRLAYVLFSHDFVSEWNFYRTPLFPLSLRAAFFLGGQQPESALLVTTLLGLVGTLLLGATVRRIATGTSGAITLLILAVYPVLIGYEHSLLSETGTFFFLALLLFLFTWFVTSPSSKGWSYAFAICLVLAAGYYWRPTIIYLSPVMAVLCVL